MHFLTTNQDDIQCTVIGILFTTVKVAKRQSSTYLSLLGSRWLKRLLLLLWLLLLLFLWWLMLLVCLLAARLMDLLIWMHTNKSSNSLFHYIVHVHLVTIKQTEQLYKHCLINWNLQWSYILTCWLRQQKRKHCHRAAKSTCTARVTLEHIAKEPNFKRESWDVDECWLWKTNNELTGCWAGWIIVVICDCPFGAVTDTVPGSLACTSIL